MAGRARARGRDRFVPAITEFIDAQRARTDTAIYPLKSDVFAALRLTPLASVRAVILGQDPYHGVGQAHGLAFSVPVGMTPPPSLRNTLAEWGSDLRLARPAGGSLERWARHGVLLLKTDRNRLADFAHSRSFRLRVWAGIEPDLVPLRRTPTASWVVVDLRRCQPRFSRFC